MSTFDTRCPVARREQTQLVERVTAGGRSWWEPFEREILWIRESRARCRALHGGEEIASFAQHHDFYGFLTSAEGAAADARRQADRFAVTPASSLVIVAEVEVFERPAMEHFERDPEGFEARDRARMRERYGIERYANVPNEWRLPFPSPYPDLPDCRPGLDTVIVAPWAPVWSSAEPDLDPGLVIAVLRRRWAP